MKKEFKILVVAAFLFVAGNQKIHAQAKVAHVDVLAHVDVSELMAKMPAMLDAQKQLEKLSGTYDGEYRTMVNEYQNKLKKYEQEKTTVTDDAIDQTRTKEIQDMEKRIIDYRDNAQKELQQKEADIVKPIMEKVKASIQKVGKAKGYQYVLNSEGLLLSDGPDITADVKKDLGF
jgi:outer membrane protein